jgi:hypothetical protein
MAGPSVFVRGGQVLRDRPDEAGLVIATVPEDTQAEVLEDVGPYSLIEIDGRKGYVRIADTPIESEIPASSSAGDTHQRAQAPSKNGALRTSRRVTPPPATTPRPPSARPFALISSVAKVESDNFALDDRLGHKAYVEALVNFASHPQTVPPIAIGITAAWGSGKTSLMRQIEASLKSQRELWERREHHLSADEQEFRPFRTVWVDVWRYSDTAALWAALAKEVFEQTRTQMSRFDRFLFQLALKTNWGEEAQQKPVLRLWPILRRRVPHWTYVGGAALVLAAILALSTTQISSQVTGWLTRELSTLGVTATTVTAVAGVFLAKLAALREPLTREIRKFASPGDSSQPVTYSRQTENQIGDMMELLTHQPEGTNYGLAIFLDDLDRCSPNTVVDVVEAINLLFNKTGGQGAVFFVGMDTDLVAASINVAFERTVKELKESNNKISSAFGYRFLQKIFQMTFRIPQPSEERIISYVDSLMTGENQPTASAAPPAPRELPRPSRRRPDPQASALNRKRLQFENRLEKAAPGRSHQQFQAYIRRIAARISQEDRELFDTVAGRVAARHLQIDSDDVRNAVRNGVKLLERRPRDMKRYLNAFRLHVIIAMASPARNPNHADLPLIAKWTAIQMRWPAILDEVDGDRFYALIERQAVAYREALIKKTRAGLPTERAKQQMQRILDELPQRVRDLTDLELLMEHLAEEPLVGDRDIEGLFVVT